MELAPIVLFAYNRPSHTKQTLEALMLNELANESKLYIFCDGVKKNSTKLNQAKVNQVRDIVRRKKWCKEVVIEESDTNIGLATSIVGGVTKIVERHKSVIVLEDDLITSKGFLKYMNNALDFYRLNDKVMHISGFMYPHEAKLPETFFFNVPLCWGWATWDRSWKNFNNNALDLWKKINEKGLIKEFDKFGGDYLSSQLAHNISGRIETWFVKWHASVFLLNGFTLYPSISFVDNIGFDSSGVHNGRNIHFKNSVLAKNIKVDKVELIENSLGSHIIRKFYENIYSRNSEKIKLYSKKQLKKTIKKSIKYYFFKLFPEFKNVMQSQRKIIDKSYLGLNCKIYPDARISNSIVGNYTYIQENSIISNVIIGKFCSIGANLICGWGIHPNIGISTSPMFYSTLKQNGITISLENKIRETLPIKIGNDVCIGMNVTILDGITIGDGAIIGAGAVVSKNIPPYAIAVGSPIKIIKYRFSDEVINKLLKIKWWNFEYEDLKLIEKHFFDVEEYIDIILRGD